MTSRWVATAFGGPEVLHLVESEVPPPGPGQVTIAVRAAGINPADAKGFAAGPGNDPARLPIAIGYEVSGVVEALGPDTTLASGGGAEGDEVVAYRVSGGWAERLTVPAKDVFAKPATLEYPQAANLLLVGATAADMLRVTDPHPGDTVVVHGASGAVGVSLLQQAAVRGLRVVGTASERNFDVVRRFGGEPVAYGDGLEQRLRDLAPDGYAAALDTVGTDEAIDVSLALIGDPRRVVTIAGFGRVQDTGILAVGGAEPESAAFRDRVRADLLDLAADGRLTVPVARTYPFGEAPAAVELLLTGHPGGKLALVVD